MLETMKKEGLEGFHLGDPSLIEPTKVVFLRFTALADLQCRWLLRVSIASGRLSCKCTNESGIL